MKTKLYLKLFHQPLLHLPLIRGENRRFPGKNPLLIKEGCRGGWLLKEQSLGVDLITFKFQLHTTLIVILNIRRGIIP
jgi:hypothetical protein